MRPLLIAIICLFFIEGVKAGPVKPVKPNLPGRGDDFDDSTDDLIVDDDTGCVSNCGGIAHTEPPTRSPTKAPIKDVIALIKNEVEFEGFFLAYAPLNNLLDGTELVELARQTENHAISIFNVLYGNRLSKVELSVKVLTRQRVRVLPERSIQTTHEQIVKYSGTGKLFSAEAISSGEALIILLASFSGEDGTKYVNTLNDEMSLSLTSLELIDVAEPSATPSQVPFEATAAPTAATSENSVPTFVVAGIAGAASAAAASSSSSAAASSSSSSPQTSDNSTKKESRNNSTKSSSKGGDAEAEARKQMSGRNTKKTTGRLAAQGKKNYLKLKMKKFDSNLSAKDDGFREKCKNKFRVRVHVLIALQQFDRNLDHFEDAGSNRWQLLNPEAKEMLETAAIQLANAAV